MTTTIEITELAATELQQAVDGSFYTILGAGEPLASWTEGYEKLLADHGMVKPARWFKTTGAAINIFAEGDRHVEGHIAAQHKFQADLTVLMFPIDGMTGGQLALFKIGMEDRWFDDVIHNMRSSRDDA